MGLNLLVRETIQFRSAGQQCEAWLYRPDERPGVGPMIVMAHGLGLVKNAGLAPFAERFTADGYSCLVFDYRHFGGSQGEPRQLLSVRRQRQDWEAAIACARRLPGVDPDRIALWGTSFGGGHALAVAARDQRLAAVIAQCPFTDGLASTLAIAPLTSVKLTAAAVGDLVRAARGREPRYVPGQGAPGATALMTAPDVLNGMAAITEGAADYDERIAARAALDILRYAPGRSAKNITCPVFAALCEHDTVAPVRAAQRQLRRAPRAVVRMYPIGHFDIYVGDAFERAVADYLTFLHTHLPLADR